MSQVILISLLIATFAIPLSAAGQRSAVRGLRRSIIAMVITVFVYAIAIIFVLPRFS
jgi:hypothetical protein